MKKTLLMALFAVFLISCEKSETKCWECTSTYTNIKTGAFIGSDKITGCDSAKPKDATGNEHLEGVGVVTNVFTCKNN